MSGDDSEYESPSNPIGNSTRSSLSGQARDVVQARQVAGGIHFHGERLALSGPVPHQLPGDVRGFVNRTTDIAALRAMLDDESDPTVGVLCLIAGTAGVGKTSLAVHWGHLIRDNFPDGQLYVNLRGYDPGPPVKPSEVLDRFLRALGVASNAIPTSLDDRAGLYRTLLAERRMMLVLDNAATVSDVRPLLPGSEQCLVLITSRSRLSALIARDGVRRLTLDVLSEDESVMLLERTTDSFRTGDTDLERRELARLCARLPLALRIAAERASSQPWTPLAELVSGLRSETGLWDLLSSGDDEEQGAIRNVFAWSYRALTPESARLFCLLGLHPGPDFCSEAAAAISGYPLQQVRILLDTLVGAHLLTQTARDRYQYHDLLRAYAADQVQSAENEDARKAAIRRVASWYLRGAYECVLSSNYDPPSFELSGLVQTVLPASFNSHDQAIEWYERERDNLAAATIAAIRVDALEVGWQIPAVLRSVYNSRHPFDEWFATTRLGLDAARRLGNRFAEAYLLHSLGKAYTQSQRYQEGFEAHQAALFSWREIGHSLGEIDSLTAGALALLRLRRLAEAESLVREALELARRVEDQSRESFSLHILGWVLVESGRPLESVGLLRESISISQARSNPTAQIDAEIVLCRALIDLGALDDALSSAESSLNLAVEIDDRVLTAAYLIEIGRILNQKNMPEQALERLQQAAALQRRLGNQGREAQAIDGAGTSYMLLERFDEASQFFSAAVAMQREVGDIWQQVLAMGNLGSALIASNAFQDAAALLSEAQELVRSRFTDAKAIRLLSDIEGRLANL